MITKVKLYTQQGVIGVTKDANGSIKIKGIESTVKQHSEEIKQAAKVLEEK